jgi:23S rRNA (cytosine1962-C5)-methyltransferase
VNCLTTAQGWQDYVLLDAGNGEKLELWGKIKVIRPDPQAFWPRSYKWEKPDMHYHRSKKGGGTWEVLTKNIPPAWKITYENLSFHIKPTSFKHMGLFPEQAVNWTWLKQTIKHESFFGEGGLGGEPLSTAKNAARGARFCEAKLLNSTQKGSPPKVLNLFAYTGGATVACLNAGADVTHVDAAKGMNGQARDNIKLSGLADKKHRVLTDDVMKFVKREARRGNMYDGIIMDPPVFGRGPGGEMWRLEEGLYELVEACVKLLSEKPMFFLINAYTAGFSPTVYGNILSMVMQRAGQEGEVSVGEIGLEAKSGILLPCGMYSRWVANNSVR